MLSTEKEGNFSNIYVRYFERHHNAVYFGLGILFLLQIILFFQIHNTASIMENNNEAVKNNIDNLTYSMNQSFSEVNTILLEHTKIQGEMIKDLELLKLSKDFTNIAGKSLKSVVSINAFNSDYTQEALGAGFFITSDGYAITNYHVIEYMHYVDIITSSKDTFRAKVVGYNDFKDIALLKIDYNSIPLEFADSNKLQIGQKVIAIGNPLGLEFSLTEGVISGLKRQGDNNLQAYIQTDVSINPGNSGGPLINSEGKVVGLNTFKYVDQAVEGMGFALESNEVKSTINQIANFELLK